MLKHTFNAGSTRVKESSLTFLSLIFTSIKVPRRMVMDAGLVCSLARDIKVFMQLDNSDGP